MSFSCQPSTSRAVLETAAASAGESFEMSNEKVCDEDYDSDEDQVTDTDLKQLEEEENGGEETSKNSEKVAPPLSLSKTNEELQEKMKEESLEFAFLQPVFSQVLQNPSEKNLAIVAERVEAIGEIPAHMSEFVVFPFAVHVKVAKTYKESQRIQLFKTFALVLQKAELRGSFEMFGNVYEKLHVVLSTPKDMTKLNKQLSEDELSAILDCICNLTEVSLGNHIDTICTPDKVRYIGHSIYLLLQMIGPDSAKIIRLKALEILDQVISLCDGKDNRSKVLFMFLPGLISGLRKICNPSAGQTIKVIALKAVLVMGLTIRVCTEFQTPAENGKADETLSRIIELLSNDFILCQDIDYRKSFFDFCCEIACRSKQLPICTKVISTILLQMKGDSDQLISGRCNEVLKKLGLLQERNFENLIELVQLSLSHLNSGNDMACVLSLREATSVLATRKLSFIEFQSFLPVTFDFMNEVVWKFRNKISPDSKTMIDPIFDEAKKLCKNLTVAGNPEDIVFELSTIISDFQSNMNTMKSSIGTISTINLILKELFQLSSCPINEFEAANFAEVYLSLIDMQSTEVVLNEIASDVPATQSSAEIRKACFLEGLGILGKAYPEAVIPIVLYPLIEHSGSSNSEMVNEASEQVLQVISSPKDPSTFLRENIDFILNEVSKRMLNLILYPNCPNALIFLAQYFDFSNDTFSDFINTIFEQCSDKFGGGNVQHVYVKVFYALIKSISSHFIKIENSSTEKRSEPEEKSIVEKLLDYQNAIGIGHPSSVKDLEENVESIDNEDEGNPTVETIEDDDTKEKLGPVQNLVVRISHRVLNFLPNDDRSVRLTAMDCLILGLPILKNYENAILPLSHTIWQNLVPRLEEKDYVIVRKSFELLKTLCVCCGGFLKKRTIEEAFPKLSTLLLTLAKDGEQVKNKNRQYYTYTQAYKLQLTVLQGMGILIEAIDVQEFELDKIVSGCIMYLKPDQHKNLRDAAIQLLESISTGKRCRTVWMKLVACGLKTLPETVPHPEFVQPPNLKD